MTNMGAFRERGITIVRGEGSTVWDDAGNALIDVSAALWYCNVGYGREELAEAAAAQMLELASYKTYDGFTSPPSEELASRIAGARPARRREGLLHLGRRRVDRHRREALTRVLGRRRQARQARRSSRASSPTTARTPTARPWAAWPRCRVVRPPRPRGRAGAVGRRRGARGDDRPRRRRPGRGVLRRADHRRRRRDDPARRISRARPGDLPRARGAARRSTR